MDKITAIAAYVFENENKYILKDVSNVWGDYTERQRHMSFNAQKYENILSPEGNITLYNLHNLINLRVFYITREINSYSSAYVINGTAHGKYTYETGYAEKNLQEHKNLAWIHPSDKAMQWVTTAAIILPNSLKELHAVDISLITLYNMPQSIEVLNLAGHNITDDQAQQYISPLKNLKQLTMSNNKLTRADFVNPEAPLEKLIISNNAITEFPPIVDTLKCLDLSNNCIAEIPFGLFPKLDALEWFNISHNPLYIPLTRYTRNTFAPDYSLYVLSSLLQTKTATGIHSIQNTIASDYRIIDVIYKWKYGISMEEKRIQSERMRQIAAIYIRGGLWGVLIVLAVNILFYYLFPQYFN